MYEEQYGPLMNFGHSATAAGCRYFTQRFSMQDNRVRATCNDIGTEEVGHRNLEVTGDAFSRRPLLLLIVFLFYYSFICQCSCLRTRQRFFICTAMYFGVIWVPLFFIFYWQIPHHCIYFFTLAHFY